MKKAILRNLGVLGFALLASQVTLAEQFGNTDPTPKDPFMYVMEGGGLADSQRLDDTQMIGTRGEFWPMLAGVLGIAAVDIALQTYFWGTYVPSVSGGGGKTVTIPTPVHR